MKFIHETQGMKIVRMYIDLYNQTQDPENKEMYKLTKPELYTMIEQETGIERPTIRRAINEFIKGANSGRFKDAKDYKATVYRTKEQQIEYNKTRKEREAKAKHNFEEDLKKRGISRTFGPQSR